MKRLERSQGRVRKKEEGWGGPFREMARLETLDGEFTHLCALQ